MNGGGLAQQLGWHVRTPRRAHLCHHFHHASRRCGVLSSRSLRRLVLFGDGDAGSRQRRGFSRCDNVETVWQAHEMRQAAGHGVVSRQAGRDCRRRRTRIMRSDETFAHGVIHKRVLDFGLGSVAEFCRKYFREAQPMTTSLNGCVREVTLTLILLRRRLGGAGVAKFKTLTKCM